MVWEKSGASVVLTIRTLYKYLRPGEEIADWLFILKLLQNLLARQNHLYAWNLTTQNPLQTTQALPKHENNTQAKELHLNNLPSIPMAYAIPVAVGDGTQDLSHNVHRIFLRIAPPKCHRASRAFARFFVCARSLWA